jgi:hypothetical protein
MGARLTQAQDQRRNNFTVVVVVAVMVGNSRIEAKEAMVTVKVRMYTRRCVYVNVCICVYTWVYSG